ncbi:MAG: acyltransferase [Burkholderiales bacterium]
MSNPHRYLEPSAKNAFAFAAKGYSWRELLFKGIALKVYSRIVSALRHPLAERGRGVDIDHRAVVDGCRYISLGDGVLVQRGAWLVVPLFDLPAVEERVYLSIGGGTRVGANCTISAARRIDIGKDVLFGPNVTVLDHAHAYEDPAVPVSRQGVVSRGGVRIGDGSWLGANSIIYSAAGELSLGEHCVVAGNSFVRDDVPPFTVVAGNPARPVRRFDRASGAWVGVE